MQRQTEHHAPVKGGLPCNDRQNIMLQLKEVFHATTDRRKNLQILTLPPHSIKETKTFFATSTGMVKTSCQLKKDYGILPLVPPPPHFPKAVLLHLPKRRLFTLFMKIMKSVSSAQAGKTTNP